MSIISDVSLRFIKDMSFCEFCFIQATRLPGQQHYSLIVRSYSDYRPTAGVISCHISVAMFISSPSVVKPKTHAGENLL